MVTEGKSNGKKGSQKEIATKRKGHRKKESQKERVTELVWSEGNEETFQPSAINQHTKRQRSDDTEVRQCTFYAMFVPFTFRYKRAP